MRLRDVLYSADPDVSGDTAGVFTIMVGLSWRRTGRGQCHDGLQVQAVYPLAVGEPAPSRQYRLAGAAGHGVLVDGGRVVWATLGRVAVSCLRAGVWPARWAGLHVRLLLIVWVF
jgi:hypothetical protein